MLERREVKIGAEQHFLLLADFHDGATTRRSSDGALDFVHVTVQLAGLCAEARVGLLEGIDTPLTALFDDLAEHWRGWKGEKEWRAYEDRLALSCVHDGLGHVTVTVELHEQTRADWFVRGDVPLEAGQLDQVARELHAFIDDARR